MGQGQSRAADDDLFIESGVRVTQGLLEQLAGRPRTRRLPPPPPQLPGGGAATAQALRSRELEEMDAAAAAAAAQQQQQQQAARGDRSVARALERSRRVGTLLLKHEEDELARIGQLADELVAREYAAPHHSRPCQQQADDCVRCYAEHAGDPLVCAAAVDAYSACAKQAWAEALQRSSGP